MGVPPAEPGKATEGEIVASRYVTPSKPGRYTLKAVIDMDYGEEKRREALHVHAAVDVPITVTQLEPKALQEIASQYYTQVLQRDETPRCLALDALFAMPEAVGLPIWNQLIDDPKLDIYGKCFLSKRLKWLRNKTGVRLLVRLWGGSSVPEPVWAAEGDLLSLYRVTEDTALKAYIREVYVANGGLPDRLLDGMRIYPDDCE
jgi:hypothetical protein